MGFPLNRELLVQLEHALDLTSGLAAQLLPPAKSRLSEPLLTVRRKLRGMRYVWYADSTAIGKRLPVLADVLVQTRQKDALVIRAASRTILQVLGGPESRNLDISPAVLDEGKEIWTAVQEAFLTLAGPVAGNTDVLERLKDQVKSAREGLLGRLAGGLLSIRPLDEFDKIRYTVGNEREMLLETWTDRIAAKWKLHGRLLKTALVERGKELGLSYKDVKREAVAAGLQEALCQVDGLYRVRLDKKWIKRHHIAEEPVANLRPSEELLPEEYWRWIENQAIRNAEARLQYEQEGAPSRRISILQVPTASSIPVPSVDANTLDALVASEAAERAVQRLALMEGRVTLGQKRVLDALGAALQETSNETKARKIAAQRLGMSRSTLRVHLHNIRRRT